MYSLLKSVHVFFAFSHIYFAIGNYVPWNPVQWSGHELLCDNSVCQNSKNRDLCCSCHSKAPWEIISNHHRHQTSQNLHIEYMDLDYNSLVLSVPDFNTTGPAKLFHRNGNLKRLSSNICNFPNIVLLDLTSNKIDNIEAISCLRNLEILKLDNNLLDHLDNKTFNNMTNLREVSLANNQIKQMDPRFFSADSINIFNFDISGNQLKEIDVTNVVMDKLYCDINYEHNLFQDIGNTLGWKVNMNQKYGTGMVRVGMNPPMHFPNYEQLGFSVTEFPKLFKILRNTNYNFGNNSYVCDCKLEPILRYSHIWQPDYHFIFPNFPNFTCSDHGPNAGINALTFLNKIEQDKLICSLDNDIDCPSRCHCYDQPSRDRIVVNCTGQKFDSSEQLERMPTGIAHHLELYFAGTGLKSFTWHKYIANVSLIDVSDNEFEDIGSIFPENTSLIINLKTLTIINHNLKSIPRSVKQVLKDPTGLFLGDTPIDCDCQNVWIGEWRTIFHVNKSTNPLYCKVGAKILPAEDVTGDFLQCNKNPFQWTWLVVLASILLAITLTIFGLIISFQHEVQILFRSLRQDTKVNNELHYDVYVSYDVNEFAIRTWVLNGLRRELTKLQLRVYDTFLDTLPGSVRDEVVSIKMSQSRHIVVVLSKAYLKGTEDSFCAQEFLVAVKQYLCDKSKTLLIVNFDNIESSEVKDPYMKAFIRLGKCLNFADRHENVIRKVVKSITREKNAE